MRAVVITGSGGLIGAEATRFFANQATTVVGIDNDMRSYFFGDAASTEWAVKSLEQDLDNYSHVHADIRDQAAIDQVFRSYGSDIELVIHTAAQPSHDWAATEPRTDFAVNAVGTLNLLEACRLYAPKATFILTSTNKVYGDSPNQLDLVEEPTRWELNRSHPWAEHGIPEEMTVDQSTHSLFGVSKLAGDSLAQEYGRYFGLNTGIFRGGCLTGPGHAGTELHGFLAYLVKCAAMGIPYTVFGYEGKQVRDNIHAADLVSAFDHFHRDPKPGEVYNIGGGRHANCSMLEAIEIAQRVTGKKLNWTYSHENRIGDHIWWISDTRKFRRHFPDWTLGHDVPRLIEDIFEAGVERWI